MKKILCMVLCIAMLASVLALVGCGKTEYKFGLGVDASIGDVTDASDESNGTAGVTSNIAAVIVDADGKVVKCFLDCADYTAEYTLDGEAVANTFETKRQRGNGYGMSKFTKEWFEQADIFEGLVIGKTVDEIKALMATDGKGTEEVKTAGCTIYVNGFVKSIEKAIAAATVANVTADSVVSVGVATQQAVKNAAENEGVGSNKLTTNIFAAAKNADGVIEAAITEVVEVEFTFDENGASTFEKPAALLGKLEQGDDYGMKSEYGSAKEWYEHAAAFNAATIGKKAGDVASLMQTSGKNAGKGNDDLMAAGCTIYISGFVLAAAKA